MIIHQKEEGCLAIEIDEKATIDFQRKYIKTDHDRIFGYMFYLIRKYFGINQTQMGSLFYSSDNMKGLSKSAYSKVENGYTSINFNLIMIFSSNFGVNFNHITNLFYSIVEFFYYKDVFFLKQCGHFGFGLHNGYMKEGGTSDDYLYTDLKDYKKFISTQELENFNRFFEENLSIAKNAAIYYVQARG